MRDKGLQKVRLLCCVALWAVLFVGVEARAQELADEVVEAGWDVGLLEDPAALQEVEAREREALRALDLRLEEALEEIERGRQVASVLESQLANDGLPETARDFLTGDLVAGQIERARQEAERGALEETREGQARRVGILERVAEHLAEEEALGDEAEERALQRLEEADRARQQALRLVASTREREAREVDQEIRELLVQERELAQEIAEIALREEEQLRALRGERRARAEHFSENRARINARIAEFPPSPRPETVEGEIDPLFRELLEIRRDARRQLYEQVEELRASQQEVARLSESLDSARSHLARQEAVVAGESEVALRRRSIAGLRALRAERELEMARDVARAQEAKNRLLRERAGFYHEAVESLLPRVSAGERSAFLYLRSDENWRDARDAFRHAAEQARATLEERLEAARVLPERALSVPLWIWIFGLLWRCLLFPIAFFFGRDVSSRTVRRLTDYLLERRFFRRRAAVTVKAGEILQALVEPALLFVATLVVVNYVAEAMGEFALLAWMLHAVFIYWMVMTAVKVLVMPRGYRPRRRRDSGDGDGDGDGGSDSAGPRRRYDQFEDLINLELSRAHKIVLSTRIVLLFWLLAYYIPALVLFSTGHTVVWRVVDRLAVWGLLAVVYVVVSTWRSDIVEVFARLARDRMPRAAAVVRDHQDRPWGVLLVGLASVYVVGREVARWTREYLIGTEWSRKLSNFFFRKKIELQQREREGDVQDQGLPAEYREFFRVRPLIDEAYMVERKELLERIDADLLAWKKKPRKGAIAVLSEQGMGRTTLFNQVFMRWLSREDRVVSYMNLESKAAEVPDVQEVLASHFGMLDPPKDTREFVQALLELPPRIVLLDDCHHFFLRQIGGFEAIDHFFKIVSATDHHHFWLLSFNRHTWAYINRVRYRGHFFQDVIEMEGWSEEEVRQLIQKRNELTPMSVSFTELVVATDDDEEDSDHHYEIVRTSNGYFRLLSEFSQGNPSVALTFWLRSLTPEGEDKLQVGLFPRPALTTLKSLNHDYLFALASIAQHGSLTSVEVARTIHAYEGDCELIVEYLDDGDIIEIDPVFQRARIRPLYLRSVTRTLRNANVLYG